MSFIDEANSIKSKLGLKRANTPLLIGMVCLIAIVLVVGIQAAWTSFSTPIFTVEANADDEENPSSGEDEKEPITIFVHIGGEVNSPGLYELEENSRVADAVSAAGGFTENAYQESVNLARTLQDGEQLLVASIASENGESAATTSGSTGMASNGKVNINLASVEELTTLNGIGEATANKIIAYRESNGSFSSIEELKEVSGIGDKKFENIKDSICV